MNAPNAARPHKNTFRNARASSRFYAVSAPSQQPNSRPAKSTKKRRADFRKYGPAVFFQMLATTPGTATNGTVTKAAACTGEKSRQQAPGMGGSPIPTKPFAKPAIKTRPQRTLQDNARCGLASSAFAYKGYFARSVTLQSLISTELNIPADENGSLATNFSTAARSGAATTKNVPAE